MHPTNAKRQRAWRRRQREAFRRASAIIDLDTRDQRRRTAQHRAIRAVLAVRSAFAAFDQVRHGLPSANEQSERQRLLLFLERLCAGGVPERRDCPVGIGDRTGTAQ